MIIHIKVKNNIAVSDTERIVCDNTDYKVRFEFDEEWSKEALKIVRFVTDGEFSEAPLIGNEARVPRIYQPGTLIIGVYAGNLHASAEVRLRVLKSVLTDSSALLPAKPFEALYDNLRQLILGGTYRSMELKNGYLIAVRNDNTEENLGLVAGKDGRGILSAEITDGELKLHYTDGEIQKAGDIAVPASPDWEQTDSQAPDYILHSPVGIVDEETFVLLGSRFGSLGDGFCIWQNSLNMVSGQEYYVQLVLDGTVTEGKYTAQSADSEIFLMVGSTKISNTMILDSNFLESDVAFTLEVDTIVSAPQKRILKEKVEGLTQTYAVLQKLQNDFQNLAARVDAISASS